MIYQSFLTENAAKAISILDGNLPILYEHLIKFISRQDAQSSSWIGSIDSALKNIIKVKKNFPAAYKHYVINFDLIYNEIISKILKENTGKKKEDFNHILVFNTFNNLDNITDVNFLKQFLLSNLGKNFDNLKPLIMKLGN